MKMQDNIVSKDENIDEEIYQILNEAYREFIECYGDRHGEHIKNCIENITDKVKKATHYYSGDIASANAEMGVVYTKSDKLSAVLKHEMWHVYNNSAVDREKSLQHIPNKYLSWLDQSGYLKQLYDRTMKRYKEKWKDEPERLQYLLVDYEEFKNNRFNFGDSPVEMWTEWFNSKTHLKDMQDNFWDWGNGFFTKNYSSNSFYDSYINIADMISCIIPKDKLLEMYLQTGEYKTEYSYPEMIEDFDKNYEDSLNEDEKATYQYPYLKIIMNVMTVSENARRNPAIALDALQQCMKTCFNAYSIKLDNIKEIDVNQARQIFDEIKYLQEYMVWNVDISKMQEIDSVKAMEQLQEKFKIILKSLDMQIPEVQIMNDKIDYKSNNPYKFIENGDKISQKIVEAQEDKECIVTIGEYKTTVGKSEIKGNLYSTLFTILGEEKYNLLYEKFNDNNEDNILLKFYDKIENIANESDIIAIYNEMYELYEQRLESNLKTDENISTLFNRYSKEIIELQKNALFDENNKKYIPGLENIINLYNQRVNDYIQEIDKSAEIDRKGYLERGKTIEEAIKFSRRIPDMYMEELNGQQNRIDKQRKIQLEEYQKKDYKYRNIQFTEQQMGKAIIGISTEKKDKAMSRVNQDVQLVVNKENKKEGEEL